MSISLTFVLIYLNKKIDLENYTVVDVYFFDPSKEILSAETRQIKTQEKTQMIQELIQELWRGSKKHNNYKTVPDEAVIVSSTLSEDKTLILNFNDTYNKIPNEKELIFRGALVWTLTELDFIDKVTILVDDLPLFELADIKPSEFTRKDVVLNLDIIPNKNFIKQTVTFFYPDYNTKNLKKSDITIDIDVNDSAKNIVDEFFKPTQAKDIVPSLFSEDVKILSIIKKDTTCYIDLSRSFLTAVSKDETIEKLQIYSIVNTLTHSKLLNVRQVDFLVENKRIKEGTYGGKLDLTKSFSFNEYLLNEQQFEQ